MFSNAVKIFSLYGFDVKLDPSWALIAALITWSLSQHHFPSVHPDQTSAIYLAMAVGTMLLFFGSLLLHELAHSVVARRFGMRIGGITLFLFGGVAELEDEPPSAGVEFWVALAGPVMSLCLALAFWFLSLLSSLVLSDVALLHVLNYLFLINLVLAVFNLLPAFPLDGGRIFRAYLWHRDNDSLSATRTAAKSGTIFAYVLMSLGVLGLFSGATISGLWQIMIGGFLLMAARSSYQNELVRVVFKSKTVSDVMHRDPISVSPELTLSEFVNNYVLQRGLSFVPVVEGNVLLGHVDKSTIAAIDRENWSSTRVGDVFVGLSDTAIVSPDIAVRDLMATISQTGTRKFLVVAGDRLLGVISLSDLVRYLAWSDPSGRVTS